MKLKKIYNLDKSITELFLEISKKYPDNIIYKYKDYNKKWISITYKDFSERVKDFANGLIQLNLSGKKMGIISDNCYQWMIVILASMGLGGIDVPRGNNTNNSELKYILNHADVDFICLQNKESYEKVKNIKKIKIIFDVSDIKLKKNEYSIDDIIKLGKKNNKNDFVKKVKNTNLNDVTTIIYTSGTTGNPKGAMLTHKNLLYAPVNVPGIVKSYNTQIWLSILPTWHVGGRFFEFMGIIHGMTLVISSIFSMRDDMILHKPHLIPGVPIMWKRIMKQILKALEEKGIINIFYFFYNKSIKYIELKRKIFNESPLFYKEKVFKIFIYAFQIQYYLLFHRIAKLLFYNKFKQATGDNVKFITSGAGNLPKEVDDFYEIIGFDLINGYGSTETATLVTLRTKKIVKHTIGKIMPDTLYKIINPDNNKVCKAGETGLLYVKGDQIFTGYYKNDEYTRNVLDKNGWYNTGDLVKETINNDLLFMGRLKDTIVLLNGENVEPEKIEDTIEDSDLINYAVVFGQDKEYLSVLIVPDFEQLKKVKEINDIKKFFIKEIKKKVNTSKGFIQNELVKDCIILKEEFKMGYELTNTMKKKRHYILEKYKNHIEKYLN